MMVIVIERFNNSIDNTFSHYSLVVEDEYGEIIELATCVTHDTEEQAQEELEDLNRQ